MSPLVSRLLAVFERRKIGGEIILVNDGSTDATGRIIDSLASRHPEVVAIHHPENRGLSGSWDTGLEAGNGRYVCFIDADLQNPPEEVWRLYREITQSRADMVQGVRSAIGRLRDGRYVTSWALNLILNLTFAMSATDNKSGFVIALRETMTDILRRRFRYRYFHVFIAVAAHAKGFTLREVETLFQNRNAGESYIKRWPVRLITDVCLDTVKAFVEFRLCQAPVDGVDQFLRIGKQTREPVRYTGWRRLLLEAYFLSVAFRRPLITRRVRRMYQALMRIQWAPPAQIRQLQELRLRRMIRHAYHHVPYYREVFDRLKIRPEEIQTLSDLQRLPLLSKKDVSENLYFDLFADNHRKQEMQRVTASGLTGQPFDIYVDRMQLEMRLAGTVRASGWTVWQSGDRHARRLCHQASNRQWIQVIREQIRESLIHLLSLPTCEPWKDSIEHREPSGIAYECEAHDGHHIAAESYIVEVLKDGRAAQPGEVGELVITDLNSFSVPLIRYCIGDRAVAMDETLCACGRGLPRIGRARERVQSIAPEPNEAGRHVLNPANVMDGIVGKRLCGDIPAGGVDEVIGP